MDVTYADILDDAKRKNKYEMRFWSCVQDAFIKRCKNKSVDISKSKDPIDPIDIYFKFLGSVQRSAKDSKNLDIYNLQESVIQCDPSGRWCYEFARDVKSEDPMLKFRCPNILKLQEATIQKDRTGEWCYHFARDIDGADISKLQESVIEKDPTGEICYRFIRDVKKADIIKFQDAIVEKDLIGNWGKMVIIY
jgi:hypothetical protein